jgi:hypothetical protein
MVRLTSNPLVKQLYVEQYGTLSNRCEYLTRASSLNNSAFVYVPVQSCLAADFPTDRCLHTVYELTTHVYNTDAIVRISSRGLQASSGIIQYGLY